MTTRSEARSPWIEPADGRRRRRRALRIDCRRRLARSSLVLALLRRRFSFADPGDRRDDVLLGRRFGLEVAGRRPRRSTTMRSATSKTSTRLWLITTTPSPRSRSRRIRSSTCAVCATPSAAVGSSRITTFGSPSSERATATYWRWPPESVPTSLRTLGIVTARRESSSPSLLHRRLVELPRDRPAPGAISSLPEEQVGDDVEVVAERQVLVDGRDPQAGRVLGHGVRDLLAVERCPGSAAWIPAIVLTSVDLPAPLSPTRATTSPALTSKSTRS